MKSLIKMSILPLFICLSLNGKALAALSCNEVNYSSYVGSSEKTQKLITETGVGCNLRGADLGWANLRGAEGELISGLISKGLISQANLTRADLGWANLSRGADLTGADLTGADLAKADLTLAAESHKS